MHRSQDEIFYVIDGELDVTCGDDSWKAGSGALVFLPRGVAHGFAVAADKPARTLLINAPAGFADLIVELASPAGSLELPGDGVPMPAPDRIAAASARHGIEPALPAG